MRMLELIVAVLIAVPSGVVFGVDVPVQELYPFDIVGRIVNADNVAYDARSGVVMRVRDADGKLLAQATASNPNGEAPWNFVLAVPISSARTPGYAMQGDGFELSAKLGDKVYTGLIASADAKIGTPGDKLFLRIMLAEDANGNGIGDTYEEAMRDEMWVREIEGDYNPEADYDGDGQSNRTEYLAGTDPFDKHDLFRASAVGLQNSDVPGPTDLFAVTFEANAGRSYGVVSSPDLTATPDGKSPEWQRTAFRLSRDDPAEANVTSLDARTWEVRTIYLLRDGGKRFFKVVQELDK